MGEQFELPQPQVFTLANVPGNPQKWDKFRKIVPTPMIRINGPFVTETREGPLTCNNGWLAVDQQGFPYPIEANEHARTYELITDEPTEDEIAKARVIELEAEVERLQTLLDQRAEAAEEDAEEAPEVEETPQPAEDKPEPKAAERKPAARPQPPRRETNGQPRNN